MRLKVLGSGSSGNCYILENDTEALIIEAGISIKEVKIALDFNVKKIVGVLVSHHHGDHAKYMNEYIKAGIPVYAPYLKSKYIPVFKGFKTVKAIELTDKSGRFTHTETDGSECPCYGFYIEHYDMGKLLYISDTELIKWNFQKLKLNHILVEANYSEDLINNEAINRNHVLKGHLSIRTAANFISDNDNPSLQNVVLIHLSNKNADSVQFSQKIKEIVKYGAKVYVAEKGLEVGLNLCPF